MVKQLKARIRLSGPLSVADYMKEVLTNPTSVGGVLKIRSFVNGKGKLQCAATSQ